MIGLWRLLQRFLQLLYLFGEIINRNIRFIMILWILSLITLGVVYHYGIEEIESQRSVRR